jgi:flagellar biosynthesis protein FlhF
MGFKRFVGANTRDAMRQVRQELGDEAVILASKKVAGGRHEILAAAADAVEAIVEESRRPRAAAPAGPRKAGGVESFQDFLRRQATAPAAVPDASAPTAKYAQVAAARVPPDDLRDDTDGGWDRPAAAPAHAWPPAGAPRSDAPTVFRRRPDRPAAANAAAVAAVSAPAPTMPAPPAPLAPSTPSTPSTPATTPRLAATAAAAPVPLVTAPVGAAGVEPPPAAAPAPQWMAELQSLRSALQEQLTALSTSVAAGDVRRSPIVTRLMTRLLSAGFSVELARRIVQHVPPGLDVLAGTEWLQNVLAANLKCTDPAQSLVERQGVYALVGPTGVGKTTTVAKLAARFAVKYGAQALGLLTLDAYRVAAHEQLRTYGRILGTPVHLAQDAATLRELLAGMAGKRLVLIDTCGLGPRDERLGEMLAMLAGASTAARPLRPVLLLNAGSHAETLAETARAWRAPQAAGCILTKLDEAARIGGALDCALRYRLALLALTNGQRVPEDLHAANPRLLAHLSLKPGGQAFALSDSEAAALAAVGK